MPTRKPKTRPTIPCRVCKGHFQRLACHLRKHGMTAQDYKRRFPGAKTVCAELSRKISEDSRNRFQTDSAYRQKIVTLLDSYKQTDKYKKRQSVGTRRALDRRNSDPAWHEAQRPRRRAHLLKQLQDPEFVRALQRSQRKVTEWTKPERSVREILRGFKAYRENRGHYIAGVGFIAHGWLPTKG